MEARDYGRAGKGQAWGKQRGKTKGVQKTAREGCVTVMSSCVTANDRVVLRPLAARIRACLVCSRDQLVDYRRRVAAAAGGWPGRPRRRRLLDLNLHADWAVAAAGGGGRFCSGRSGGGRSGCCCCRRRRRGGAL